MTPVTGGGARLSMRSIAEVLRRPPVGVLVLGVLLGLLGVGFVGGALYLLLSGRPVSWGAAALAIAFGPLCLYVATHLVRLTKWAWLAVTVLFGLLLASSLARAALMPGAGVLPYAEIVLEGAIMAYLMRGGTRRMFGRR